MVANSRLVVYLVPVLLFCHVFCLAEEAAQDKKTQQKKTDETMSTAKTKAREAAQRHYDKGVKFFNAATSPASSQIEAALRELNLAISMDPTFKEAYSKRAECYAIRHSFDHCIEDLNKVISLDPEFDEAFRIKGDLLLNVKNDLEGSLKNFEKAIALSPLNAKAFLGRSMVYTKMNDLDKAILDQQKAVELDPLNPKAFHALAMSYLMKEDLENSSQNFYASGMLYLEQDNIDSAKSALDVLQKVSTDPTLSDKLRDMIKSKDTDKSSSKSRPASASQQNTQPSASWDSLVDMLKDPDPEVRKEAALGLGTVGNETHVKILEELLNDPNPKVQKAAKTAMELIKNKGGTPPPKQ